MPFEGCLQLQDWLNFCLAVCGKKINTVLLTMCAFEWCHHDTEEASADSEDIDLAEILLVIEDFNAAKLPHKT